MIAATVLPLVGANGDPARAVALGSEPGATTIEDQSVRVLADPLFSPRLGHLHRCRGPPPAARSRRADLAVVSHLHVDHLHVESVLRFDAAG